CNAGHLVHGAVRRDRLCIEETGLSPGAAGAGADPGRPDGGRIPAGHAGPRDGHARVLVELAGGLDHHPGAGHAGLAADLARLAPRAWPVWRQAEGCLMDSVFVIESGEATWMT